MPLNSLKITSSTRAEIRLPRPTEKVQNHWRLLESKDKQEDLFNINGKNYNCSRNRSKTCNLDLRVRGTDVYSARMQGNKRPKKHLDTLCAKGTIAPDFPSSLHQHRA